MKKFLLSLVLLFIVVMSIESVLVAAQQPKVVLYNFTNLSKNKKVAHYSTIISDSIHFELDKAELYDLERKNSTLSTSAMALQAAGKATGADYLVSGSYQATNTSIKVNCIIYTVRNGKYFQIAIPKKQFAVFLNDVMSYLSQQVNGELQKYSRLATPVISPAKSGFDYYQTVKITTGIEEGTIYYTTDGSEPRPNNGKIYTKPFDLFHNTRVRTAVSTGNDFLSDERSRTFVPNKPISLFEIKAMYGVLGYLENGDGVSGLGDTGIFSFYSVLYFGGFDSVKKIPFIRDLGIGPWLDFASAGLSEGDYSMKMQGYSGGLFYKARFHRHFMMEFPFTFGSYTTSVVEGTDLFDGMFSSPSDNISKSTDTYLSTGAIVNIPIGFFQFNFGATYKRIFYDSEAAAYYTLQGGVGFNF